MKQTRYTPGATVTGTDFQYLRTLGSGGQGEVYLVRDMNLECERVMKLLNLEPGASARARENAMREAKAVARLESDHIVQVLSAGITQEHEPRPYFVMPWLDGATLHKALSVNQCIPVLEALTVAIQVLEGLSVAHTHPTHPVVHRDIKPANLFLRRLEPEKRNGITRVMILDFGIARLRDQVLSNRSVDMFVGTPDYAAPEQYGLMTSPQTDLYAVAGILFRMLAGRPVFQSLQPEELSRAHLFTEAPRLSRLVEVPKALDDVIACALQKKPELRPASAEAFATQLRRIAADLAKQYAAGGAREQQTTQKRMLEDVLDVVADQQDAREVRAAVATARDTGQNGRQAPVQRRDVALVGVDLGLQLDPRYEGAAPGGTLKMTPVPAEELAPVQAQVRPKPQVDRNAPTNTHDPNVRIVAAKARHSDTEEIDADELVANLVGARTGGTARSRKHDAIVPKDVQVPIVVVAKPPAAAQPAKRAAQPESFRSVYAATELSDRRKSVRLIEAIRSSRPLMTAYASLGVFILVAVVFVAMRWRPRPEDESIVPVQPAPATSAASLSATTRGPSASTPIVATIIPPPAESVPMATGVVPSPAPTMTAAKPTLPRPSKPTTHAGPPPLSPSLQRDFDALKPVPTGWK
jgi:eukaryotic-like serine/threonine-protein kinase